jgi:hypothetical protein
MLPIHEESDARNFDQQPLMDPHEVDLHPPKADISKLDWDKFTLQTYNQVFFEEYQSKV